MREIHPDAETLARYVRGELGREPRRALERHLMGCATCQKAVDEIQAAPGRGGVVRWQGHRFEERRARWEDRKEQKENLGGVMRGLGNLVGMFAEKRVQELLRASEHERRALIRDEEEVRTLPVCELLEARCREAWLDDPEEAVELAKLALRIAEKLDLRTYGADRVEHAKALAWMHLGNSYRIAAVRRRTSRPGREVAEGRPDREAGEDDAYPPIVPRRFSIGERPAASPEAETALWELRDACLERGLGFDAALVTLELALVYLRQGREADVRDLAKESVPLFEEKGAQSYVTDAMRFLRDAAQKPEPLTPSLLTRMAELLQRQRNDPRHRKEER